MALTSSETAVKASAMAAGRAPMPTLRKLALVTPDWARTSEGPEARTERMIQKRRGFFMVLSPSHDQGTL